MEYRRLGHSGLQVSALSLGSWLTFGVQVGDDVAKRLMMSAYEAGVNFFDGAEAYAGGRAEIITGNIIAKLGWPRDTFLVSSKAFFGAEHDGPNQTGLSRKHLTEACHASLRRLRVDYLDLYFCHRPDPDTPIEETVWTMTNLVQQGKILYWGTSEWPAKLILKAYNVARQYNLIPPSVEQPEYNMFRRQRFEEEYAPLYEKCGLGATIWSPLDSGILTGKYNHGIPGGSRAESPGTEFVKGQFEGREFKRKINLVKELQLLASDLGTTMPCLAIAWCLQNPNVNSVITGASRVEQLEENLKALDLYPDLDDEIMDEIDIILDNRPEKLFTRPEV